MSNLGDDLISGLKDALRFENRQKLAEIKNSILMRSGKTMRWLVDQLEISWKREEVLEEGCEAIGKWMSAALEDPKVCAEMKKDINTFFKALHPEWKLSKFNTCPCGGVILADTEDWDTPLCIRCYDKEGYE